MTTPRKGFHTNKVAQRIDDIPAALEQKAQEVADGLFRLVGLPKAVARVGKLRLPHMSIVT